VRLFEHFPGDATQLPIAQSMHAALDIVREYARYHEHVGGDWPVDHLTLTLGTKVLAVADAYETLQLPTATRPAFPTWAALDEIERGMGLTFATDVVRALRGSAGPESIIQMPELVRVG
jgi:hypothetical protein